MINNAECTRLDSCPALCQRIHMLADASYIVKKKENKVGDACMARVDVDDSWFLKPLASTYVTFVCQREKLSH